LRRQFLVLELIEPLLDGGEFGVGGVGGERGVGGRSEGWSVRVGAVTVGGAFGGEL